MELKYILTKKENGIETITFHRPEALNALCSEILNDLAAAVEDAANDPAVRVIIFTGEGKSFIAGADINEMNGKKNLDIIAYSRKGANLFRKIETMPKPTIAAINGYTFGGGLEFALACDIRIAHEKASFSLPEATLGIVPGFNATQRLPKVIGMQRAKEMMFTGRRVRADEALAMGLLFKVTPLDTFWDEVMAEAETIANASASAIGLIKSAVTAGAEADIDVGKDIELGYMTACFGTDDQIEGFNSFFEKRKPVFRK